MSAEEEDMEGITRDVGKRISVKGEKTLLVKMEDLDMGLERLGPKRLVMAFLRVLKECETVEEDIVSVMSDYTE